MSFTTFVPNAGNTLLAIFTSSRSILVLQDFWVYLGMGVVHVLTVFHLCSGHLNSSHHISYNAGPVDHKLYVYFPVKQLMPTIVKQFRTGRIRPLLDLID